VPGNTPVDLKTKRRYSIESIVILLVKWYQKIAPRRLRESCRFEPSCSNYMILAMQKYGIMRGLLMGFRRIARCRYPNGGIDYP